MAVECELVAMRPSWQMQLRRRLNGGGGEAAIIVAVRPNEDIAKTSSWPKMPLLLHQFPIYPPGLPACASPPSTAKEKATQHVAR